MDATLPALELQDALQRFTTQFADRVTQAMEALERASQAAIRDEALRKNLLYVSSALEIASGLDPEVNLLDMIVFVHLSRATLEKHWIPVLYREMGADLAEVFARSEKELEALAEQALTSAEQTQILNVVDTWLAENPNQFRVEGIRLAARDMMADLATELLEDPEAPVPRMARRARKIALHAAIYLGVLLAVGILLWLLRSRFGG